MKDPVKFTIFLITDTAPGLMGQAEQMDLSSVCLYLAEKADLHAASVPTTVLTMCSVLCWLCKGCSCDFISILQKPMILLDSLDGVMNAHKMNDFALSLGLLSLQSVFIAVSFDSYSRS